MTNTTDTGKRTFTCSYCLSIGEIDRAQGHKLNQCPHFARLDYESREAWKAENLNKYGALKKAPGETRERGAAALKKLAAVQIPDDARARLLKRVGVSDEGGSFVQAIQGSNNERIRGAVEKYVDEVMAQAKREAEEGALRVAWQEAVNAGLFRVRPVKIEYVDADEPEAGTVTREVEHSDVPPADVADAKKASRK